MWKYTNEEGELTDSFLKIALMIENLKEPIVAALDTALATISLKYDDDSIVEAEYIGSLSANDMVELSEEILKIIPSGCFYPGVIR